jgi:FixJ family two-component response regulator
MKPIWIVDDDPSIRFVLEKALGREGWPIRSFTQPRDVLKALADVDNSDPERQAPQVLVSDIRMPGGSGLELLEQVRAQQPGLPMIIMTAYSDLDSAVSAFQRGAFEYLPKPFDVPKAVELIRRAVEESQREEVADVQAPVQAEMLGQAPAMQDVFRAIGRLSQSHVTVLITGESGAGKELVARRCTSILRLLVDRLWPSIPPPFRKICWSPNCSATSAAPLPARRPSAGGVSSRPKAVRCFSMKSATCRSSCRRVCCGCSPTVISTGLADIRPSRPMCV